MVSFRTTLEAAGGTNVAIVVPDDVMAALDRGKRVPVVVTVDGGYSYRTTTASLGGRSLVSFNAETRAATGRGAGDVVEVSLEVDDVPRSVDVPPGLSEALAADPVAAAAWAVLSVSRQRQHALAVDGAKTDATRARRVDMVLSALRGGA